MFAKSRFLGLVVCAAWLAVASCQGKVEGQSSCTAGQMMCGGSCATVAVDPLNCGACGVACAVGQVCQAGQCACSAGLLACSGSCVASNAAHCGSCTTVCSGIEVCSNGTCQASCPTGETQCSDGACVPPNGGDATHCGGCNACPAGATCNAGVCMSVTGTGGMGGMGGMGGNTGTGGTGATPVACTPMAPTPRRLWRLSVEQWGAAVKDLLGLTTAPILTNRGGQAAYAFFSDATLGVDENFQFALYKASQDVVLPAIASRITTLAPCTGTTAAQQTACAMTFVQSLGPKAFRRPLETAEVPDLMAVYANGAMMDYATGISLLVQALITSPSFVYRTELGPKTLTADASGNYPNTTLNPYEVASQLGFLFLGSLPDPALTAAAADGSLGTAPGVTAQIDRLLALPAVRTHLTNVLIDWFNVRQMFDKANKDTALFTVLATADRDQAALTADLYTSTQMFVNDVLWTNNGTINDLMTSTKVFFNRRLSMLFPGVTFSGTAPANNTTFVAGNWPTAQGRAGMLTQPSFLWSASDTVKTSIVKRGKLLHDDIVCQDELPPPIDLGTPQAVNVIGCKSPDGLTTLSACDTEVLQSDARMLYAPCKNCHAQMDLYSRVLQNFGPIGNYRTADEGGRAIDASVTFTAPPLAPQMVSGSAAFGQLLASSGVIKDCSVQKVASYAMGNMIRHYNTCEVNDIRTQTNGTVTSLFKQVALANILRARAGGAK